MPIDLVIDDRDSTCDPSSPSKNIIYNSDVNSDHQKSSHGHVSKYFFKFIDVV